MITRRVPFITRYYHVSLRPRHSDDEGDRYAMPKLKAKKGDHVSRLPPILPPTDPRKYMPKDIPAPNNDNTIFSNDHKQVEISEDQQIELDEYLKRLTDLRSAFDPSDPRRLEEAEKILTEMDSKLLPRNPQIIHALQLLNVHREETKEEIYHRTSKPSDKKQSDPDFFTPLIEKQQVKTNRLSQEQIDEIFKSRGTTRQKYKEHLRKVEDEYQKQQQIEKEVH
ncbi:hypothetical protein AKO1_014134 [Acrasis kona]|uniref:Uncharacterized protein n=1 Tax=Acrasis kona TaxID=1008807 RepID=A0AAW2YZD2_9EUKA